MRYIFWQNILSIHQSVFIRSLADADEVFLVVQETIGDGREKEGWNIPNFGKAKIVIAPAEDAIQSLVKENRDAVHVFSGINSYEMVYVAFKASLKYRCKRIVLAEPYRWFGLKGFLRRLKYMLLFARYGQYIDALLTTGETGERAYRKAFFPTSRIFQWGYFTEGSPSQINEVTEHDLPKLLFVGKLDNNKNVLGLVSLLTSNSLIHPFSSLTICGGGEYEPEIRAVAEKNPPINYVGIKPNKEVQALMRQHDILILPSLYDGWGAVVNEALTNGMRCIASENCGSSVLLKEPWRGAVFSFTGENSLQKVLEDQLALGVQSAEDRKRVVAWSRSAISGEVAAEYFRSICDFEKERKGCRIAPWMNN